MLGVDELPYFIDNGCPDGDLIDAFLALHRGFEGTLDPMAAQQLMIESFARLFARHGSGRRPVRSERPDQYRVSAVIELMRARYHEPLSWRTWPFRWASPPIS